MVSKEVLDRFRKVPGLGNNIDSLNKDFEDFFNTSEYGELKASQEMKDCMFAFFILGLTTAMSPKSNFNRNYKY